MLRWPRLFLLERLEQVVVLHQRVLHGGADLRRARLGEHNEVRIETNDLKTTDT